ncbi:MAG: AAA family ATPase [Planctomycetota bacterium]
MSLEGEPMAMTLTGLAPAAAPAPSTDTVSWKPPTDSSPNPFPPAPPEPETLEAAGLHEGDVEALVLKTLLQLGVCTGSQVAAHICLPRRVVGELLDRLRDELLIAIKSSAGVHDFAYQLTDAGFGRARQHAKQCNYSGAAPIPLDAYATAIRRQSIQKTRLRLPKLKEALSAMTLSPDFVSQLAQAINDGRGMFLYGSPGNGKTTLAEQICDAFGQYVWVPRMIGIGGDLLRLFDPSCHQEADAPQLQALAYDRRWVLIRRPTVVVGGELTLDQLDASYDPASGISEAPVQLKANGGALLIDDFGRQRVSSSDILNRLIVPLEKQFDFLHLASGRQVQTPFDLLFILSTNLEPRELVDEAFLRRIAYKIEVHDPTEAQFRALFSSLAKKMGYEVTSETLDLLIEDHFKIVDRPMRFCHPRDLLRQVKNYCEVHELPKRVTSEAVSVAVRNYFAGL